MKGIKNPILLLLFFVFFTTVNAQQYHLKITSKDSAFFHDLKGFHFNKIHPNKKSAIQEVKVISKKLAEIGYFNNAYNLVEKDTIITSEFILNKKLDSIRVYFDNAFDTLTLSKIDSINILDNYFEIATSKIEKTLKTITQYYESTGYSFSSIYLQDLKEKDNILFARLIVNLSKKRYINKIVVKGYPKFPKKYLNNYIGIKKKEVFNKHKLENINNKLNELPFISQIKKPAVLFNKDSTTIFIYLKKKSINNFDGIIGFNNQPSTNKIQLNGYLNLNLTNIFNKGESFQLKWKSFQKSNKSLDIKYSAPYILNSPITTNLEFSLFKQDSTYFNTKVTAQLNYEFKSSSYLALIYNSEKSNLIQTLPQNNNFSDYTNNYIGLSYTYFKRNSRNNLNPYRYLIDAEFLFGNRKTISSNSSQNKIRIKGSYLIKFNTKNNILLHTDNALLFSSKYYQNELYRIGGFNSIHGFDEQSIFTSKYSLTSLNYFYNLNKNNAIYTITDFAITEDIQNIGHKLYSIGLGLLLKNKEKTINLSYALGKFDENPFNFRESKFHLGIIYPF